jgi:predicted Abi (CAAX) family protease
MNIEPAVPEGPPPQPGPMQTMIMGLKQLPDFRAAIEGLILFLLVVGAGIWGVYAGVLTRSPAASDDVLAISIATFFIPALGEELVFRGWLRRGMPIAAVVSLLAYIAWHPAQTLLHLPFGRPEFVNPDFLILVATIGAACTLSRVRSGSIWPAVAIHWGAAVVWRALFAGPIG